MKLYIIWLFCIDLYKFCVCVCVFSIMISHSVVAYEIKRA